MRIRGSLLAALIAALVIPAAASADTTIGITAQPTGSTSHFCPSSPAQQLLFEFGASPPTGPLSVPSSSGPQAVTQWSVNALGVTDPQQLTLVVLRIQLSPPTLTVIGTDTETLTPPASSAVAVENFTLAHPIPVQTGDAIAQYAPATTPGLTCYWSGGPSESAQVVGLPLSAPPVTGEQISPAGPSGVSSSSSDLNLSATLSPLSYDAGLSLSSAPANAVVGQPAVLTATVTNTGPLSGPVTFTDPIPAGLTVDYAGASSGSCTTSAVNIVSCSVADVGVGQSEHVAIVVTPTSAKSYTDSGAVSLPGGGIDPNPANNLATTSLHVSRAGAPTQCTVPKLAGASLALVKRVLPLLGCEVGKVKKAASRTVPKGDVISTKPGAGSYALNRKIAITVSSGKPKKHKK